MEKIGVIGAGSFGTALAQTISNNVKNVVLYSRRSEISEIIEKTGYNLEYYPNIKLNQNIVSTNDLNDLNKCTAIFICVPSSVFRETLKELKKIINDNDVIIVTTAKGIEYPSLNTMGKIIEEYFDINYVALSGPNFASEIMLNSASICNIASKNTKNAKIIKNILKTDEFKVEIINDTIGLELCGVIKNINAIAYGICEGMDINENARYAVLTRGFNDTKEILDKFGGSKSTVNLYCGFGDIVLTSTSKESRNHTLGMLYGQKIIVDEKSSGIVFEGKNSIKAIKNICDEHNINSAVVNFVYDVIIRKNPPKLSFKKLWEEL